ncbi:superoxide dismutase [Candidatus Riesia pthiripubis]|uniref:Superoxide dismutase n=1 Tax=Candidatus Riesia pthiripubis TaxID=428412 RepID=A0A1V0HPB0_9ENTR|nr:superoxide dismutase [Candidatus Riesia pthiripubis]ARC55004.1 superoxide dismutase [Candidatus Riesia sp. GBBU]ARC55075.1 superoxide dismutase [Candidatus Riesia sp. GBBU]
MKYILPDLPYKYNFLEPYIDSETMEIHHQKHHQNYVNKTNIILKNFPNNLRNISIEELIKNIHKFPKNKSNDLINNAGGHINHTIYWQILKKNTKIQENIRNAIEKDFLGMENFKKLFEDNAMKHFGSGWTWLIFSKLTKKLSIVSTANQDNPLMKNKDSIDYGYPIFCIDLWEHAYYLKYRNAKLEYIKSFWSILNWEEAERRYCIAK